MTVCTMSFYEKVVLITDDNFDIGTTTAVSFAKEGASIAIVGKNVGNLKKAAQRCEEIGVPTLTIKSDLAKDAEADLIVKQTIDKFGKLDILVNHAGIPREAGIMSDHFLKTYDNVMNVNVRGAIRITYFAIPYLIKTKGNIVNVSSMAGISTKRTLNLPYRTSKAAMTDFTKTVGLELSRYEVRVTMIDPVPDQETIYNRFKDNLKGNDKALKTLLLSLRSNGTARRRLSDPNKIADKILYVSSDRGKSMTSRSFWLMLWTRNRKKDKNVRNAIISQYSSF